MNWLTELTLQVLNTTMVRGNRSSSILCRFWLTIRMPSLLWRDCDIIFLEWLGSVSLHLIYSILDRYHFCIVFISTRATKSLAFIIHVLLSASQADASQCKFTCVFCISFLYLVIGICSIPGADIYQQL